MNRESLAKKFVDHYDFYGLDRFFSSNERDEIVAALKSPVLSDALLRERCRKLEEALHPIEAIADVLLDLHHYRTRQDDVPVISFDDAPLTLGLLRKVRALLNEKP